MVATVSQIAKTVFGNYALKVYNVTPDAATATWATGMNSIAWAEVSFKDITSMATFAFAENAGVSGTSIAGQMSMTSVVSGDIYRVSVYGSA